MKNVTMVVAFVHCLCACADTACIGAYVIDAVTQEPIPNIKVSASFSNDNGWKAWTESAPIYHDTQETDVNGFCALKGKTNIGRAGCGVDKQGEKYYGAGGRGFHFTRKNFFGVWQPDNLVATIRLQRVEHPIPLCVKSVELTMRPEQETKDEGANAVLQYDLVAGDWLPPVGHGKIADLTMKTHSNFVEHVKGGVVDFDCYERSLSVVFPGNGNGIAPIVAKPTDGIKVRQVPSSGYVPAVMKRFGRKKSIRGVVISPKFYSDEDPNRCYVFRIRSQYDEKGNLVEAYYGKIYGDFNFSKVWYYGERQFFLYYLNPKSLDRNLEWDMKNNLCPNSGSLGQLQP